MKMISSTLLLLAFLTKEIYAEETDDVKLFRSNKLLQVSSERKNLELGQIIENFIENTLGFGGEANEDDDKPKKKVPLAVLDTDYGPFIDDVFAVGLILNTDDIIDFKYILTTAENTTLAAKCVSKHLAIAEVDDIGVGVGATLRPYEERGGVCAIPGLIGFALEEECLDVDFEESGIDEDGIEAVAKLIMESDRDDWLYVAVGGQTSVMKLIEEYPEAAEKVDTLIIMGGNFCADFFPYPDVLAPTDETNVSCDPIAANFILDKKNSPFNRVYYTPVVVADEIGGDDYAKVVEAARNGYKPANATIEFYKSWSEAARADPSLLVHLEALAYDPDTESTPQFDACAIMFALELYDDKKCEDRLTYFEFKEGIHFLEAGEGLQFPDQPRAGFSLVLDEESIEALPEQCPSLTPWRFDPDETIEDERSVFITLGYKSQDAKDSLFASMAARMAGEKLDCA